MKLSMQLFSLRACSSAVILLLGAPGAGLAQTAPGTDATATPAAGATMAPGAQPDYHPSLGDLMTMAVQPRHTKLGLAGKQKNWAYATYELSELRNAFTRISRTIPRYQGADTAELVAAMTHAPLDALEQAITANSATQFAAAYAQLTQACNTCHQSQKHAMVVIKVPDAAMYPDQDFRPATH